MTHEELSRKVEGLWHDSFKAPGYAALRAVVALHKPLLFNGRFSSYYLCEICSDTYEYVGDVVEYPCPTIQAIEKELK